MAGREPLRIPQSWKDQARVFVIQLERILDKLFGRAEENSRQIEKNTERIDGINDLLPTLVERITYKYNIDSSNDANNLTENGIYYITSSVPSNVPSGMVWCLLYVNKITDSLIHQYIFRPSGGAIVVREYSGYPSAWTQWMDINGYDTGLITVNYNNSNDSYYKYRRVGHVITVEIFHKVSVASVAPWSTIVLGTLPVTLRPATEIVAFAVTDRAGSAGCTISVSGNGNVVIGGRYTGASDTNDIIRGTLTYTVPF